MRPCFTALLVALGLLVSLDAVAQTAIRGRALVLVDTSGSMVWHFNDCSSAGGDGGNPALFCDNGIGTAFTCAAGKSCTAANGALPLFPTDTGNPSRLYAAKAALNDVINSASGSLDFGLERFAVGRASDFGGVAICTDSSASSSCCTPQSDAVTRGRCVPKVLNAYPDVPSSVSCVSSVASDCNLTFVSGCGTSNGCTTNCATTEGGQILVSPAAGSSTTVLPWTDFVEDFCASGAGPRNPELRAAGATPLAGSVRTALDHWYQPIYAVSKTTPTPGSPLYDAQIDCRPYVNVVMTDGVETCEGSSVATSDPPQAVAALYNQNPTNPVKTYVIGLAINSVESCNGTAADSVVCPHTATGFTNGCTSANGASVCACNSDADCGVACEGGAFHYRCDTAAHVCRHPGYQTLNAMAAAGGTGQAHFVNNQAEIESVFADIVASTVKVELCDGKDNDCDGACDEPFPDVAVNATAPDGTSCSNPHPAKSCDNGALPNSHCYATGVFVCSTDHRSETCAAPTCATNPALCPIVETCNGVDDDCNGVIDDCTPFVPYSCCKSGCIPQPEVCNGKDDDCDGVIDEPADVAKNDPRVGVVGGSPCTPLPAGHTQPPCNPGITACVNGAVVCQGEVLPQPNQCDGVSRDCTGQPNTTGSCPSGTVCYMGGCATPCSNSEFPCSGGFTCVRTTNACGPTGCCLPDPCLTKTCPSGDLCRIDANGAASCVDPCTLISCPSGYACQHGTCMAVDQCQPGSCPAGQVCSGSPATCQGDACAGVVCPNNQYCSDGACIAACPGCKRGETCIGGRCVADPCSNHCSDPNDSCVVVNGTPTCVTNLCAQGCASDHACCGGTCLVDPCAKVSCPSGTSCVLNSACQAACDHLGGHDFIVGAGSGSRGCSVGGFGGGSGGSLSGLILAFVLLLLARRRGARGGGALVALAVAALTAGCHSNPYCLDCADGAASSGPHDLAGTGGNDLGPATVCVPTNNGVEICDHIDNDCDGVVDNVDPTKLASDPNNCGQCFVACDYAALHEIGACVSGACKVAGCQPGYWDIDKNPANGCEYPCTLTNGGIEICDGLDNDCNGLVDDGLTPPANLCATKGVCAGRTIPEVCKGALGWFCDYSAVPNVDLDSSGNLTITETRCDGLDNNCNGVVDKDGFPTLGNACGAGKGACQMSGTVVCATLTSVGCSASAQPFAARDEQCNGLDDDCDGQVDERTPLPGSWCYTDNSGGGKHPCRGWADVMVPITEPNGAVVYVYAFEASRPGATAASPGSKSSRACSAGGVLPWAAVTETAAQAACAAVTDSAGQPMRLCAAQEWTAACEGPAGPTTTSYSLSKNRTSYVANICNDVNQGGSAPWPTGTATAQATSAGEFCFANWGSKGGIYDLSGNLDEWTSTPVTSGGTTYYKLRGGAYNSQPGGTTCEFDFDIAQPTFLDSQIGFRCCADHAPCGNLQTDPSNCGACGNACLPTQVCSLGACAASCATGLTNCGGACVDPASDGGNCGACGNACTGGQICSSGTCACPTGTSLCGGVCVNQKTDPSHCGSCSTICAANQVCVAGACSSGCGTGLTACNGSCVNEQTDPSHCGSCGNVCPSGQGCAMGSCCPTTVCGGFCVNPLTDNNNCGACGRTCGAGTACSNGTCCATGQVSCNGVCSNTATDNNNCGACGIACGPGTSCQSGACCATGGLVCNNQCVNPQTDSSNCGSCGTVCGVGQLCTSGHCCGAGQSWCGSSCSNTQTDPNNCGGCGISCNGGQCTNGSCACPPGQSFCGGKCIVTSVDPNNCGGCNNVCPVGQVCWASGCSATCPGGFNLTACNGQCDDFAIDDNNCGSCGHACTGGTHCFNGACATGIPNTSAMPCASEPGPTLGFSTGGGGGTTSCSGNVAATSFTWALCDCSNFTGGGSQLFDAYNSQTGPVFGPGGSVGVNGTASSTSSINITGDLWCSVADGLKNTSIGQQLHTNSLTVATTVAEQGYVAAFNGGSATFTGNGALGNLYTAATCPVAAASFTGTPPGSCVSQPGLTVPQPCTRCALAQQVPIAGYVSNYAIAANNNDALIGLSPTALASVATARLDLPCGIYYLSGVNVSTELILAAHGNTALFIGGDFTVAGTLYVTLDPTARLDIFIAGNLNDNAAATIGTPAYPSQLRFYIGGTGAFTSKASLALAADMYLPNGPFSTQASVAAYGSLFVGSLGSGGSVSVHYDKAAASQSQTCPSSSGGGCTSCLDCANQACNNGVCGSCTSDGQCCAPLRCVGGSCQFTSF